MPDFKLYLEAIALLYEYSQYFVRPRYAKLIKTTEVTYDQADPNKFATHTTTYDYSFEHLNLIAQGNTGSDGSQIKTTYKYPPDFDARPENPDWAASSLAKMTQRNILAPVVEQQTWKKTPGTADYRLVAGTLTKFKEFGPGRIHPAETHSYRTAAPVGAPSPATRVSGGVLEYDTYNPAQNDRQGYEPGLIYKSYDTKGNILNYKIPDGSETCYLWGYNAAYPVAEIKNATYDQVKAALGVAGAGDIDLGAGGLSAAQKAALRINLPQAMVTTYDYTPLVGMTSMTDPNGVTTYYEYDDLQRLVRVKDRDGNLLKENTYHYKGQPE